jgi:SAM-dependent methyltransferase
MTSPVRQDSYVFSGSRAAQAAFDGRTARADAGFLLPYLRPGMRVVDCGCGAGNLTLGLAELVAPGEVVGFDISERAIDEARRRASARGLTNVQFFHGSVYASGLSGAAFDLVFFCGVLAHLTRPEQALDEAFRLLKPGGLVGAREPEKHGDWAGGRWSNAYFQLQSLAIEEWQTCGGDPFLGGRLPSLLSDAGFIRVSSQPSFSPALSCVDVIGTIGLQRLKDPDFIGRAVERGLIDGTRIQQLTDDLERWMRDESSIAAISECTAIGWKPAPEC